MSEAETNKVREHRMDMKIIVSCYNEFEWAMDWYYYLEDKLTFPFLARCMARRTTSPLKVGDEVEVLEMAPEEECEHDIFVVMRWEKEGLSVPLSQLEVIHADNKTKEAVEDWCYWTKKGYQF